MPPPERKFPPSSSPPESIDSGGPIPEHLLRPPDPPEPDAVPDTSEMPDLVVSHAPSVRIDLTRPEDCADRPDGEWSRAHLGQFLARQPKSMVFIPKEAWEPKAVDCFQIIGYQGHWFRVIKNKPILVPLPIAE